MNFNVDLEKRIDRALTDWRVAKLSVQRNQKLHLWFQPALRRNGGEMPAALIAFTTPALGAKAIMEFPAGHVEWDEAKFRRIVGVFLKGALSMAYRGRYALWFKALGHVIK